MSPDSAKESPCTKGVVGVMVSPVMADVSLYYHRLSTNIIGERWGMSFSMD